MKWQYYLAFFLGILLILLESAVFAASKIDAATCTYQGKKLYGKVQIVDSFPMLKVKVVNSFPDLKVKQVNSFPDKCGLWQFVDSFPDLKIQFVDSFPDLKIQFVNSFPGIP
jgi:hypothetical protein